MDNYCMEIHKWKVEHDALGYNLRMANINASIGYNQLCNLKKTLSLVEIGI